MLKDAGVDPLLIIPQLEAVVPDMLLNGQIDEVAHIIEALDKEFNLSANEEKYKGPMATLKAHATRAKRAINQRDEERRRLIEEHERKLRNENGNRDR